jgi:hypothetical protein
MPVRRTPCDRFLTYLVLLPDTLTDEQVRAEAHRRGLLWASTRHLQDLRLRCKPPEPFHPYSRRNAPSVDFLERLEVTELFRRPLAVRRAFEVTERPRVQQNLEPRGARSSAVRPPRQRGERGKHDPLLTARQ